jgi:hypothetical protein
MKRIQILLILALLTVAPLWAGTCGDTNVEANQTSDTIDQYGWTGTVMTCTLSGTQSVTDGYFYFSGSGVAGLITLGLATIDGGTGLAKNIVCSSGSPTVSGGFTGWFHVTFTGCTPSAGSYGLVMRTAYTGKWNYGTGSTNKTVLNSTSCCTLTNFSSTTDEGDNSGVSFYLTYSSSSPTPNRVSWF